MDNKVVVRTAAGPTVPERTSRPGVISTFCHSSIGRKFIVAVTGVILILFVLGVGH